MFLGVSASVAHFDDAKQTFTLVLEENPLIEFVELPPHLKDRLQYSALLCGVIRGALEVVQMKVTCRVKKEPLRGDAVTELKVKLLEIVASEIPIGDEC